MPWLWLISGLSIGYFSGAFMTALFVGYSDELRKIREKQFIEVNKIIIHEPGIKLVVNRR